MSSSENQTVTVRELLDEAKKRIVLLVVCVFGLSYLMSLTSPSLLVNLPAALFTLIVLRYMSLDIDMRRKAATYKGKGTSANSSSKRKPFEGPLVQTERSDWKHKVNSRNVEDAIDQFTRHIVSEWVTDLWYSRIAPDRQGPEELVLIINGVFGEISSRMKNVNLIDLLTRNVIDLLCCHLEFFRACKTKIEKQPSRYLTVEERDIELKFVLAAENKLHPILFSSEAEHKVLQHVVDGLILLTFKKEDLQCSLFRYITRELLACVVLRPVLNLANPRFINERIESLVISAGKIAKVTKASKTSSPIKGSPRITSDNVAEFPDSSLKGVELVQVMKDQNNNVDETPAYKMSGTVPSEDPLLSMDTRSTRLLSSSPEIHNGEGIDIQQHGSGGEWGDKLDMFSHRKTKALAPKHFDNMWTKGRNYMIKEDSNQLVDSVQDNSSVGVYNSVEQFPRQRKNEKCAQDSTLEKEEDELKSWTSDEDESWNSGFTENEDTNSVTGLDSPGTKVWDNKSKRNFSHIHHPLEAFDGKRSSKMSKGQLVSERSQRTKYAKKRSRSSRRNGHAWQEVERTTFLLGDEQDVLNSSNSKLDSSEDSEAELSGRMCSGATTSSSMFLASLPESHATAACSAKNLLISNSFLRLRCEVLGANIVKSGSKTFAVYSISVTDVNSNNWSIKRRFRHFEELHRRLKEFPVYNLHLPPKHFLSTGLNVLVIQERCILLDQYLKRLLQLPTISCSIEVWDFLSVDSQMYIFSNSLSIIKTLSVREKNNEYGDNIGPAQYPLPSHIGNYVNGHQDEKNILPSKKSERTVNRDKQSSHSVGTNEAGADPTRPSEWVPPNLGRPILNLIDVILQLKDGGWIRRKAFWVAKQVLQLGMGDAFDDWLLEKIQLLRQGSVVASGIRRLEQILWPDGIFITKHPKRQQPPPTSPSNNSHGTSRSPKVNDVQQLEEMQQKEAEQRAKFVYELMIDKAPTAIVGLVGHKEYEQCVKDLYYFIQSSVCVKLLAFDLLELLLLSVFPELDYIFRQLDEGKEKFGTFELKKERQI